MRSSRKFKSKDDIVLLAKNHNGFFESSLSHDTNFNNKAAISAENALASLALKHSEYLMPSIHRVSHVLLNHFTSLVKKVLHSSASDEEIRIMQFFVEPFKPDSPDKELGRMIGVLSTGLRKVHGFCECVVELANMNEWLRLVASIVGFVRVVGESWHDTRGHEYARTPALLASRTYIQPQEIPPVLWGYTLDMNCRLLHPYDSQHSC